MTKPSAATTDALNDLFDAFANLQNRREAAMFCQDILTEYEMSEFSNRWMAARMLERKESYAVIQAATGLSSTTIARVHKWLSGDIGGYRLMIERLKETA